MKVMKFGGTSVGSAERIKSVVELIRSRGRNLIVLSAMSGTTNSLVEIAGYLYNKNADGARDVINSLSGKYEKHIAELCSTPEYRNRALEYVRGIFAYLASFTKQAISQTEEKIILAQGELMSTYMMTCYLQEQGIDAVLLPALDFMKTDAQGEPDSDFIKANLKKVIEPYPDAALYITQGYICRNASNDYDNLQRGGSDYSASLIGAAIVADEIQIWTDIDGMHNNDPRIVDHTSAVHHIHFEEASELAYFGAKVLHPTCIQPAKNAITNAGGQVSVIGEKAE